MDSGREYCFFSPLTLTLTTKGVPVTFLYRFRTRGISERVQKSTFPLLATLGHCDDHRREFQSILAQKMSSRWVPINLLKMISVSPIYGRAIAKKSNELDLHSCD